MDDTPQVGQDAPAVPRSRLKPRDPADRLMTAAEVADWLRIDPKTVGRWVAAGRLRSIKTPGGHHRFKRGDIQAIVDGTPDLQGHNGG